MAQGKLDEKWTVTLTATAGNVSLPQVIPGIVGFLTALCVPGGGGSAKVQYTMEDPTAVVADPSAVTWVDWDEGVVSVTTAKTLNGSASAVRLSAIAASATLHLAGTRLM